VETLGVFRPSTGQWFLRNDLTEGPGLIVFYYGNPGDTPVVGNWDSTDTADEIGVVRGNTWYLRSSVSGGNADLSFAFGTSPMQPMLGDWDGDGDETPAYHR
jgi:hypothetical protein